MLASRCWLADVLRRDLTLFGFGDEIVASALFVDAAVVPEPATLGDQTELSEKKSERMDRQGRPLVNYCLT